MARQLLGDGETIFPLNLLLTNTQVLKIRKAFANSKIAKIKFSKTHLPKKVQSVTRISSKSVEKLLPNSATGTFVKEMLNSLAHGKLAEAVENKRAFESVAKAVKMLKNAGLSAGHNTLRKQLTESGIRLTNNEIKNIIKVINSSENRRILSKETTKK